MYIYAYHKLAYYALNENYYLPYTMHDLIVNAVVHLKTPCLILTSLTCYDNYS